MVKPKKNIWKYFKGEVKDNKTIYSCIFCKKQYAKNATRMAEHLAMKCMKCPKNIQAFEAKGLKGASEDSPSLLNPPGPSPSTSFASTTSLPSSTRWSRCNTMTTMDRFVDKIDVKEEKMLNKKLASAIFSSGCPFSLVENPYWKDFFSSLRPSFKLPTRKDIGGKYLDREFESVEADVWTKIRSSNSVALQCDGWSNIRNEAIINFIITTPSPVLLKTMATGAERHTGEYIAQELMKCITDIGPNKLIGIVSDNAASMEKAKKIVVEQLPYITAYSCASHTLNLFIGDVMKLQSLTTIEGACKQIVKEITASHINTAALSQIQKDKYGSIRSLKMPVKTRWGSILHCISSLILSKEALQILAVSEESYSIKLARAVRDNILDNDIFWVRLDKIHNILQPIVKWITILEGDQDTFSKVLIAVKDIEKCLSSNTPGLPIKSNEENELLASFEKRKTMLLKPIHLAAYLLNPNYFGAELSAQQHVEALKFIDCLISTHPLFAEHQAIISLELTNYLGKHELWSMEFVWQTGKIANPVTWWRGICSKMKLKDLAIAILELPASSAATERSFSRYSFLHNKRRNKLTTERAGKLTFVSTNKTLLAPTFLAGETPIASSSRDDEQLTAPSPSTSGRQRQPPQDDSSSSSDEQDEDADAFSVHSSTSCAESETFTDLEEAGSGLES